MIKISDNFKTDDKKLAALYESARSTLMGAMRPFGDYELTALASTSDRMTLASEIMTAETFGRYNVARAMDCVRAFAATQREDGQLACEIIRHGDEVVCDYTGLAGFSSSVRYPLLIGPPIGGITALLLSKKGTV